MFKKNKSQHIGKGKKKRDKADRLQVEKTSSHHKIYGQHHD